MLLKEHIKLWHRAWRYRLGDDANEIAYLSTKIKKGDTVFDVGAHKGAYSYWMQKKIGRTGKLIAFEPQKKGFNLLQKLFTEKNITIEHLALSDHIDEMELFIQPQRFDVSFEASLNDKYENSVVEKVKTDTIDHYCFQKKISPSFIKIDVEGHEQQVINGAKQMLQQHKPVLLIELELRHIGADAFYSFFEQMSEMNYAVFFFRKHIKTPFVDFNLARDQDIKLVGTRDYINNFFFEYH